jgi:AraC-like DNA-binding protein
MIGKWRLACQELINYCQGDRRYCSLLQSRRSDDMKITYIKPRRELQPYVEAFWAFESSSGFPAVDRNIVIPNGCAKLIIPHENSLISESHGTTNISRAQNLYLVGNQDASTLLRSSLQPTSFISIEFTPEGAFPIFGIPMAETANGLWETDVLLSKWSRPVRDALNARDRLQDKVAVIQEQLIHLLSQNDRRSGIVDYCVQSLRATHGLLSVRDLASRTGYSRRYIDKLFRQRVGIAPKVLAGIYRFQKFYRMWAQGNSFEALKEDLYEHYYDQSHFTREFHRMTGHPPKRFSEAVSNEFGRRLLLG